MVVCGLGQDLVWCAQDAGRVDVESRLLPSSGPLFSSQGPLTDVLNGFLAAYSNTTGAAIKLF